MINIDENILVIKEYRKGNIVKEENDYCNEIGFIIEGEVSITTYTYEGNEHLITILHKGDFFGDNLIFSSNKIYPGTIISTSTSKIGYINPVSFINLLSSNHNFCTEYLKYNSLRTIQLQNRIKILSQKSIESKISFYLKLKHTETGDKKINIHSKEKLSKLLNIPRPSLSRSLKKMVDEGLIKMNKNIIYMNY